MAYFDLFSMQYNYVKETNEANINENDVAAAINDINNGNCSISAAVEYGIHFATLQFRLGLYWKKTSTSTTALY